MAIQLPTAYRELPRAPGHSITGGLDGLGGREHAVFDHLDETKDLATATKTETLHSRNVLQRSSHNLGNYVTISITVESVMSISTVSPTFRSLRFVILLLTLIVFFLPSGSSRVTR